MGSPYTETLQGQHRRKMTWCTHVCIEGFPAFWFLFDITSALQSTSHPHCLPVWRPSKLNNNSHKGRPLLSQSGSFEPCAMMASQFVFFILFTFENKPTKLNSMLGSWCIEYNRWAPSLAPPGRASPWPHLPSGRLYTMGLGGCSSKAKSSISRALPGTFTTCTCFWLQKSCHAPCIYLWLTNQSLTAEPGYLPHFHVLVLLTNISPLFLVKSLPVMEGENPHLPILV